MIAIVLVGGFGTRLRPLTNDIPKPMLPVVHRPMIARLADRLAAAGATDLVLALGFRPEPFAEAFPGDRYGRVRVHYAVEPEPLDTAGAIAFAARSADVRDTFIVANGDVVTDLDVSALVDEHRRLGVRATIHLTPVADPSAFGVVECGDDDMVRRFVEKPAPGESDSRLINAGTYVLEPSVLDLVPSGARMSVERDVFPRLAAEGHLAAMATDDYWLDAGRPELYLQANLDLIRGVRGDALPAISAGATIDPESMIIESVVDRDVVIGAGCTVTNSVLLPGARLDTGAEVESSIVAGHIGAGATVRDGVIGAGWSVPLGSTVVGERLPKPA